MGLPLKLRFWWLYPNPISRNNFSILKWGLTQIFGKIKDAFFIVQTSEIEDRRKVYRKYDELVADGKADSPMVALVEEMVATDITEALWAEGIRVFPPVIFKAWRPPSVLVISKRKKIKNISPSLLLQPGLTAEQREEIERFVEKQNPSLRAYVPDLGGIAVFPPIVHLYPAQLLIEVAAHEWGHTHLVFFPLGFYYLWGKGEVASINEIACSILGREIIRRVRAKYGWAEERATPAEATRPDYGKTIHGIRQEMDRLLALGKVEEAEEFLRESADSLRQTWEIRKLNQAYFAFHGKYGGGAGGDDPTARQLRELRQKAGSLKNFLKLIRGIWSRKRFEEILAENGIKPST